MVSRGKQGRGAGVSLPADGELQQAIQSERRGAFQLPPSLRESVYSHLKQQIVRNALRPGDVLLVDRLAGQLGVSRTPIREALLLLEGDGLVASAPNHGFTVTAIEVQDIEHIYQARSLIEAHAAWTAATRIPDQQLGRMDELFSAAAAEVQAGVYDLFPQCDPALHQMILEHCGNPVLAKMAQTLSTRALRIRHFADSLPTLFAQVILDEHQAILSALLRRDPTEARVMMERHLASACQRTLHQLTKNRPT
jgi:DNA-binding GntR family transcriptional regulator